MAISIGIDLGTTNSVISHIKRGRAEIINIEGKNTFPSVLTIRNGEIVVGNQAKARVIIAPESSVASSKRDIGTDKTYNLEGTIMTPEDVAYHILKAIKEKADLICLSGLITPSLEEMCHVASEMQKAGLHIPLLIGGATTSPVHTAVKMAPQYNGLVAYMKDASQSTYAASQLLNPRTREAFMLKIKEDQKRLRNENNEKQEKLMSIEEAKKNKLNLF